MIYSHLRLNDVSRTTWPVSPMGSVSSLCLRQPIGLVVAAVNSDPDTFNGVEFSIADTQAARRKARKAAIDDAVDKAKLYVEGAGFRLGRLLLVEEGGNSMIVQSGNRAIAYAPPAMMATDAAVTPPPVAPEPQLYTSEVSVVYEIGAALAGK